MDSVSESAEKHAEYLERMDNLCREMVGTVNGVLDEHADGLTAEDVSMVLLKLASDLVVVNDLSPDWAAGVFRAYHSLTIANRSAQISAKED